MLQSRWRSARACAPLAFGVLMLLPALAAAQVRPPVPPPARPGPAQPQLPGREQLKQAPGAAGADLVIEKVSIVEQNVAVMGVESLGAQAWITLRNNGTADAVFPQGSVVVKSAPSSGGIRFRDDTAKTALTLKPGESVTKQVMSSEPCQGWGPVPVTFTADPGNVAGDVLRGNNASTTTPSVSNPAGADLVVASLSFVKQPKSGDWSDLQVVARNAGTGPVLICPGTLVLKETETPVSAKYGLRGYTFTAAGAAPMGPPYPFVVIQPGSTFKFYVANACRQGDMTTPAQWKVRLDPNGTVREGNRGNNEGAATLTPCF